MKLTLIFLAFFGSLSWAKAQEEKPHPIDKKMDECMQEAPSTTGMNACMATARIEWDKEMNRVYNALMKKLPAKEQAALKASQKAWLTHRDLEIKNIQNVYSFIYDKNGGGTMYSLGASDAQMVLVKNRALELSSLLDSVETFVEGKGQ